MSNFHSVIVDYCLHIVQVVCWSELGYGSAARWEDGMYIVDFSSEAAACDYALSVLVKHPDYVAL